MVMFGELGVLGLAGFGSIRKFSQKVLGEQCVELKGP